MLQIKSVIYKAMKYYILITVLGFFLLVILSWFVDKTITDSAIRGTIIEETEVECRPEQITNAVLDENVDVYLIQRSFT